MVLVDRCADDPTWLTTWPPKRTLTGPTVTACGGPTQAEGVVGGRPRSGRAWDGAVRLGGRAVRWPRRHVGHRRLHRRRHGGVEHLRRTVVGAARYQPGRRLATGQGGGAGTAPTCPNPARAASWPWRQRAVPLVSTAAGGVQRSQARRYRPGPQPGRRVGPLRRHRQRGRPRGRRDTAMLDASAAVYGLVDPRGVRRPAPAAPPPGPGDAGPRSSPGCAGQTAAGSQGRCCRSTPA